MLNMRIMLKKPMYFEHNRVNMPSSVQSPGASANVGQSHVALNNDPSGRSYASGSANNFIPSAAIPIVSTLVTQYHNSNNRSGVLNSNLQ